MEQRHAYWINHGRVWVESISGNLATVRYDANTGSRSRCYYVQISQLDFTREWKFI
jgi:hypothetical protein